LDENDQEILLGFHNSANFDLKEIQNRGDHKMDLKLKEQKHSVLSMFSFKLSPKTNETKKIHQLMEGFDRSTSPGVKLIEKYLSRSITRAELEDIGKQLCSKSDTLKMERMYYRRKETMEKWFDSNYETIQQIFDETDILTGIIFNEFVTIQ
jgi:hypothetical protein